MIVTLYVDYSFNVAGRPLLAKLLFQRPLIQSYLTANPGELAQGTLRNYRAVLLRVAEILLPEHNVKAMKPLNGRSSVAPYSVDELSELKLWARGQSTDLRERRAMLMLALCAGAGLRAIEVAELRGGDVTFDEAGCLITVREGNTRVVPLLAEWEPWARHALKDVADDELVFGREARSSHRNMFSTFVAKSDGVLKPRSDSLRATWIVTHLAAGTPMKALMQAAGVEKFENLARYLAYVPELNSREYRALLRLEATR
ncbi:tyrosine-type recombinase/integrase [Herbiconiux sp. SYSU D00978]|uniref:tyrosine-type recombinase/integrase n=1 Tax=Herbiconiux sp. SYSU D00978 TaxID=2812562 RepID=UPI001A96F397|nr:tyrosine-type recombinase/integrase [Herbiconiux sp. SYSU D00978]